MDTRTWIKKAVITGPTGAVGLALVNELIDNGIEVTAICHEGSKRIAQLPVNSLVKVIECNLDKFPVLADKLEHDHDVFYHFAWDGTYGESRQNLEVQERNIKYTLDAVALADALGCKVFIGAGSQSEYGHVSGILTPKLPCNPDNGYGVAKLAAGQLSHLECRKRGMRHNWCRLLSVYGPGDADYTMVMSGIIKLLKGERPSYTKGEQIWDYMYSKDAAKALRLVAEKGVADKVYCFGSGSIRRLKDYIYAIRDAVNPSLEVGIGEMDYYPNQVMHLEADISELSNDTGFIPEYSFEEGIRETVEWVRRKIRAKI